MRQLILDSNLLVLLLVGLKNPSLIKQHKRTRAYTVEDFDLLVSRLAGFDRILVTPHVLAECSNLLRQVREPLCEQLTCCLKELIEGSGLDETHVEARNAAAAAVFPRLGLTDSAILEIVSPDIPLLTVDVGLYVSALNTHGDCAVNFNHLRRF
ncbi:MAG: hypothetical protein M1617_05085 [Actinobacteria bacterium]|nr:hypothetical protein [Actinomycetota bacterium]MCL5887661.1 hypothetical protein [Actinomycetota bacterium]